VCAILFALCGFYSSRKGAKRYWSNVLSGASLKTKILGNAKLKGSNYLPFILVLTKLLVITTKNAKISTKVAKTLRSLHEILPISLQIHHEPA